MITDVRIASIYFKSSNVQDKVLSLKDWTNGQIRNCRKQMFLVVHDHQQLYLQRKVRLLSRAVQSREFLEIIFRIVSVQSYLGFEFT